MKSGTGKMYFLNKFCCICMNKCDLKHMFDVDNDGVSHYNKLTSSITEMQFKEMNNQRLICGECCVTLNTVYDFRQMCLSQTNLITYMTQQQTSSLGTIKIKNEIEIKYENEDDGFGDISNSHCVFKIKSDPDEISAWNKCGICLCDKSDLKHLFDVDNDGVSHYNKLTSSIAEMQCKEMNNQRLICGECCVTLNTVYNFRQTCLRSKTNLITYISQLQTFSKVSGTLSVRLTDVKHEIIIVKEEIEIKCENEVHLTENNQQNEFQTESYEDSIQFPASVKEECEREEDATADNVNEWNVKVEDVEHQTMMEDGPYTEYTEIDIKEEDPLALVKKEPMSDSETSQDGSTSQADAETSEEPKKRGETTIGSERTQSIQKVVGGLHKCEICKKSFNHKGNFNNHMRIHSDERPFECDICRKGFSTKGYLKAHMKLHSGEKPYECEICKKGFAWKKYLDVHMKIHSDKRPHACYICRRGFTTKGYLNAHMKLHSGESTHECEICRKNLTSKRNFDVHMQLHSGERPHECEICRKGFSKKKYLDAHIKVHSGKKPYECQICRKSFIWKSNLAVHMKRHSGERPHKCEICKKSFTWKRYLDVHMKIHSGESPYECEICRKGFPTKVYLTAHMKIHSGKKPHPCQVCKKIFNWKRGLIVHMKIHSGERPHECEICHKNFIQKSQLINHLRTHAEGSYECEICRKKFVHKKNLTHHIKIHSGGKPHENV